MLYSRITDGGNRRFDPVGSTYAEWVPRTDSPEWNDYLTALAAAADQRAAELGRAAADDAPAWAVAALGPVPDDLIERAAWQERAGVVAAYRELRGHDDQADALGAAPKAGQVEQYAAYRAAWRALGRPEVDRAIHEQSDGQLRMRVRAWQREQAWGPRYVGHELAGTRQAAAHHHQTAALRRAEADAATDPAERARLQREAAEAAALAETLDRARRAAAGARRRPRRLARPHRRAPAPTPRTPRPSSPNATPTTPSPSPSSPPRNGSPPTAPPSPTTSAPRDHRGRPRRRRPSPTSSTEAGAGRPRQPTFARSPRPSPARRQEDVVRVPTADEVEGPIVRAQRSLAEIHAREAHEQQAETDERAAELARWHDDDHAAEQTAVDESALEFDSDEPVTRSASRSGAGSTPSGRGPSRRHAHRSVARMPSHHPG